MPSCSDSLGHGLGPFTLLRAKKLLLHVGWDWEISGQNLEGEYLISQYSQLLSRERSVTLRTRLLSVTLLLEAGGSA